MEQKTIHPLDIYIAASIYAIDQAKSMAAELISMGHRVTSTWHAAELFAPSDLGVPQEVRRRIANIAVGEIGYSDVLLLLAHRDCRGSLFEAGVAVGDDVPVIALGNRLDVTLMLETNFVRWVNFKEDAFAVLEEIATSKHDEWYYDDVDGDRDE